MKHSYWLATAGWLAVGPLAARAQQPAPPAPNVGYLAFDPATDRTDFQRCHTFDVLEYYQVGTAYAGGMRAIRQQLQLSTLPPGGGPGRGYVTIRFLVNCQGATDRFRVMQLDSAYQPAQFNPSLLAELLRRTKSLAAWQPGTVPGTGPHHGEAVDSFYYLVFKLVRGQVVDVLP